ncbi:MAG: matrixin family metalloprotease [Fimbriimonadaceae bacterium]
MKSSQLLACPRLGNSNSNQFRTTIILAAALMTSAAFAQTVPNIGRWSGGTAIAPVNGHTMGNALTLTWGILRDGTATINNSNGQSSGIASNLISKFDTTYGAGPGGADLTLRPWFTTLQEVYSRWGQVSGLNMVYEANDDGVAQTSSNGGVLGVRADMRIGGRSFDGNVGGNVLAFNYFPNGGDMMVDTDNMSDFASASNGFRFLRNTLEHELGHGIGQAHVDSNNRNILMEPFIDTTFDGPQMHDILIANKGYGDKNEKSNGGLGNDTQINATSLGILNGGGSVSIGNGARNAVVSRTESDFVTIDDQTDTDFYSLTLSQDGILDLTLEVLGDIYNVGPQNGTQISFNSFQRSDLTLAVLNGSGTVLFSANANGLGGNEAISQFLTAGTYGIRITGVDNVDALDVDTQFYALSASLNAVPEPASMTLLAIGGLVIARRRRKNS